MKQETAGQPPGDLHHLYIFGAGVFGREVTWPASEIWGDELEVEFLVDRPEYLREPINGVPVRLLSSVRAPGSPAFTVALGDPGQHRQGVSACRAAGLLPRPLIHPRTEMSRGVEVGREP